jgi:hypothetical protein
MKVYDYDVDGSRHCREGIATEEKGAMFDTFWGYSGDRHRLTNTEISSAVLRFDTEDFEEVKSYVRGAPQDWLDRASQDRETISSQHGLQLSYWIRKGSSPDYATKIKNTKAKLDEAYRELRSAENSIKWAIEELEKVKREAGGGA